MSQRDIIDFSALERELQAAVESEQRYKRENAAKLRAVDQRVSYDQFRYSSTSGKEEQGGVRQVRGYISDSTESSLLL